MSGDKTCDRCHQDFSNGLPRPGMSKMWGVVTVKSWKITFNRLRMNSWEKAVTAMDVIGSKTYTDRELCDKCWRDVWAFIYDTTPKAA
jgi:hypothetical protein